MSSKLNVFIFTILASPALRFSRCLSSYFILDDNFPRSWNYFHYLFCCAVQIFQDVVIYSLFKWFGLLQNLIQEKVEEDAVFQAKTAVMEANREHRNKTQAVAQPIENNLSSCK